MAKVTEVVKEIAQTWQKLGKDDRTKYKEAAKRGMLFNNHYQIMAVCLMTTLLLNFKHLNPLFHYLIDKDRYEKELKSLVSHSDNLKKPKKCLSAYMIFVKEVRTGLMNLILFWIDTSIDSR